MLCYPYRSSALFEELGCRYFGPIDGHDVDGMIDTFTAVRAMNGPRLVHVITQKGRGFQPSSTTLMRRLKLLFCPK